MVTASQNSDDDLMRDSEAETPRHLADVGGSRHSTNGHQINDSQSGGRNKFPLDLMMVRRGVHLASAGAELKKQSDSW